MEVFSEEVGKSRAEQTLGDQFTPVGIQRVHSETGTSHRILRATCGLLLLYGCWLVLAPFTPAIFFAIAIVVSLWPAHAWLLTQMGQRRALASLVACAFVGVVVIVPIVLLFTALTDASAWLLALIDSWNAQGPESVPNWLFGIPWVGDHLAQWRNSLPSDWPAWLSQFGNPARKLLISAVQAFGNGLGQFVLAALLLFVLFRDGDGMGARLEAIVNDMGGPLAHESLCTVHRTIVGVMLGVVGTALAQAIVAIAGFTVAQVPNALLLGAMTFILSLAPIGPPLVWGGAAIWLAQQGRPGWAIFMVVYGVFGISLIDNIVKPLLISRSSRLPFALTFMGVIGGILAFGVAGVFIGPALLAVVMNLARQASPHSAEPAPANAEPDVHPHDVNR